MTWLSQNWFWVLFGFLFVGMHLSHGGHRGHGSAPARNAVDANSPNVAVNDDDARRGGHQH